MKKRIKILALLISLIIAVFTFSGCDALDSMKARHAVRLKNGNIRHGEHEYIPLFTDKEILNSSSQEYIYVTDEDVPVLLSSVLGEIWHSCADGRFLMADYESISEMKSEAYGDITDDSMGFYFCRSDIYDYVDDKLKNGVDFDAYCYEYLEYSDDFLETSYKQYLLTDKQKEAVDDILKSVTPEPYPEYVRPEYDEYDSVYLTECTKDLIFVNNSYEVERDIEIMLYKKEYYIIETTYKPSYDEETGEEIYDDEARSYKVPEKHKKTAEKIMKHYIEQELLNDAYLEDEFIEE